MNKECEENLNKKLISIQKKKKNYFLVMNYPEEGEDLETSIEENDVFRLIVELEKIKESKEKTNIILILNSNGGDPFSAYKMINMIHKKCDSLIIVVPHFAKSAATLMSLGANIIIMGEQSELGPLDLPLPEHPTKGGIRQLSALDGIRPLSYLFDAITTLAIDSEIDSLGLKIRKTGLSVSECVSQSLKFSSEYLKPITSQLDPLIINKCQRSLQIAKIYGSNLLKKYMFKDEQNKLKNVEAISHQLVYSYPTHSFAICIDIAKELGLNILGSDKFDKWEIIWKYYEKFLRNVKTKIIKIVEIKELENYCK